MPRLLWFWSKNHKQVSAFHFFTSSWSRFWSLQDGPSAPLRSSCKPSQPSQIRIHKPRTCWTVRVVHCWDESLEKRGFSLVLFCLEVTAFGKNSFALRPGVLLNHQDFESSWTVNCHALGSSFPFCFLPTDAVFSPNPGTCIRHVRRAESS